MRVPRGQVIERVTLSQDDLSVDLDVGISALPETQFIMLDASSEMVNLQQVVQANVPRLWQGDDQATSLIFYSADTAILAPTNRTDDIDNFLASYNSNSGTPACLGDALAEFDSDTLIRDYEQSWRILLITVGDFSGSANCVSSDLPTAPSVLDIIAITSEIDPMLQDLLERSGGRFYTANLRSIEARINEVIAEFGKLTYAVEGTLPDNWNLEQAFELEVEFSNGIEEAQIITFREYNVPAPATPTPLPVATATIASETVNQVQVTPQADADDDDSVASTPILATAIPDSSPTEVSGNNGIAILLIVAAILFVVGAVVIALALSRVRRRPEPEYPTQESNFYESLASNQESEQTLKRNGERNNVSGDVVEPLTQIARLDKTEAGDELMADDDHLLVTQVLSDERFRSMMEQSQTNDEIIGWVRLLVSGQEHHRDIELTRRGLVIGRSQDCDIQITGDRAISRQHARLDVRQNNQVTVSRLSAVNPVVVGGIQISNRHPLASNDVIHLSDETRLIFIANIDDAVDNDDTQH
ncbi:MAG: FHA domain-containing protein [Chloroflexota bacterium]